MLESESEVAQSYPTLWDLVDCSLPGSSVHGIFQARILEWVAFPFQGIFLTQGSNLGLPHCRQMLYHLSHEGNLKPILLCIHVQSLSCVRLCDPMDGSPPGSSVQGISQHKYWSGLPFPSPEDLPDSGIEPRSPAL